MDAGTRAAEAGMYFSYVAVFIDDDGSREAHKVGQHGQAFFGVAATGGVAGYQKRVGNIKMRF